MHYPIPTHWLPCAPGTKVWTPGLRLSAIWASGVLRVNPLAAFWAACAARWHASPIAAIALISLHYLSTQGHAVPGARLPSRMHWTPWRYCRRRSRRSATRSRPGSPPRAATALRTAGIRTLADLTVRVPRRRRWWARIPGLGVASARRIERFFAEHPALTERAHALVVTVPQQDVTPWERLAVPQDVDGSRGKFRAPRAACVLRASNDYEAVQACSRCTNRPVRNAPTARKPSA